MSPSASPHKALEGVDLDDGPVIVEVLSYLSSRTITEWSLFKITDYQELTLRLLTCAATTHVLLILLDRQCVGRYIYDGPSESSELVRRRVLLRVPDVMIQAKLDHLFQ